MLLIQAYWICQYTRTGWKNVPGSICIFPKVVPITQLIGESRIIPRLSLFIESVPSYHHLGRYFGRYPLDGIVTLLHFPFIQGVSLRIQILKGVCVPPLRFRLFSIFSMSLGTTLASLAHVILLMIKPGATSAIFGTVIHPPRDTVSLIPIYHGCAFFSQGAWNRRYRSSCQVCPSSSPQHIALWVLVTHSCKRILSTPVLLPPPRSLA